MPDPKRKPSKKVVISPKEIKEQKAERRYQCKLSILKILVTSVILETTGAVREGYITNDSVRVEMENIIFSNIEDVLKKIEDSINICDHYMKFIDVYRLEKLIIELEYMDVTRSSFYAEEIWNIYAPALLAI